VSLAARGRRTVRRRSPGRPALQKHVDFFDGNHDGRITLSDTYRGTREIY